MSDYDFIIDNIRFSYSSISSFETCAYAFKLTYIDLMPRGNNFYAEYGTLIHDVIEKYFNKKIEKYEMSQYYLDNYGRVIKTPPPPIPPGLEERYKEAGLSFFDNFSFEREDYDVLLVEGTIKFNLDDDVIAFTARPDLVLRNKETGIIGLYDYKSSAPFRIDKRSGQEIVDKKKIEGYYKQLFLYAYALRNFNFLPIDEITIWFTRPERKLVIPFTIKQEEETLKWIRDTIAKIKKEKDFLPDTSSPYFCDNLCGVRDYCEYR